MWYKVEYTPTLFYINFGKENDANVLELIINLPRNYIKIEEEKMMYLESSYGINWSRNTIGRVIDVVKLLLPVDLVGGWGTKL